MLVVFVGELTIFEEEFAADHVILRQRACLVSYQKLDAPELFWHV